MAGNGVPLGLTGRLMDDLCRSLAVCTSRRQMLKIMATAAAGALMPQLGFRIVFAGSNCLKEYPPANLSNCPGKKHHEGHTSTMNGCGPQSGFGSGAPIPQTFGDATFWPACDDHDCCYGQCGSSKAACDHAIGAGLRQACRDAYGGGDRSVKLQSCIQQANTFESFVTHAGDDAFDAAQKQDCECCHPIPPMQIYCGCNHKCYPDAPSCLKECKVTLGCFAETICGPASQGQCPNPPSPT